mgnify:CR=1 FL=1
MFILIGSDLQVQMVNIVYKVPLIKVFECTSLFAYFAHQYYTLLSVKVHLSHPGGKIQTKLKNQSSGQRFKRSNVSTHSPGAFIRSEIGLVRAELYIPTVGGLILKSAAIGLILKSAAIGQGLKLTAIG